jgi:hypothetical protein
MFVISATQIKAAPVAVKASAKKVEKKRYAHYLDLLFYALDRPETAVASPVVGIHPSLVSSHSFASWWQPKPRVPSYLTSNYSSNGPSFEALQNSGYGFAGGVRVETAA